MAAALCVYPTLWECLLVKMLGVPPKPAENGWLPLLLCVMLLLHLQVVAPLLSLALALFALAFQWLTKYGHTEEV